MCLKIRKTRPSPPPETAYHGPTYLIVTAAMTTTTPIITYNLNERGRQHTGKDRHFNIGKIYGSINGPKTQERVRLRDMVGFYGHWTRVRFGLNPAEGGIAEGRAHTIQPALVTTLLKAYPDGTVEHQAEFLDTEAGRLAASLYNGKTGGFSSAIEPNKLELVGFDYVLEPNYSTNRGYILDSVGMTLDAVLGEEYDEHLRGIHLLSDSNNRALMSLDTCQAELERTLAENDILLCQLADMQIRNESGLVGHPPMTLDSTREFSRVMNLFTDAKLPTIVRHEGGDAQRIETAYNKLASGMGVG